VNQIKKHYVAISRVKALSGSLSESAFKRVDSINSRDLVGTYSIEQENCYCYASYRPFCYANF
jgi:hypothetical protein